MTTPPRSAGNRKENKGSATIPYSLPGIICYLQHEWTKMEAERQSWNLQKAEYEAKLSLLDGEIVGLRNLKVALLRRIKMLEYALIQERRTKALKLPTSQETSEDINIAPSAPLISTATSQTSYTIRRGKQLIKKFLEEMGNIDDLIDLRCDRMKFSLQERCNEKILRANQQFDIRMSSEEVNTEVELSSLSLSTTKSSASSSLVQHSNKNLEQNGIKEDDSIDSTNNWNVNAFDVTDESTSWPENTKTVDIKKNNFNSYEVIDGIEYIPNGDLDAVEEARFFDKQIAILSSSDSQKSESITIKVASSQVDIL
ncbi:hypothetical protein GJ496_004487 [Pomphorhynchus laevis]|nr:hypothetical protein GJ496_004487 [Pomphorhynchus laevis]